MVCGTKVRFQTEHEPEYKLWEHGEIEHCRVIQPAHIWSLSNMRGKLQTDTQSRILRAFGEVHMRCHCLDKGGIRDEIRPIVADFFRQGRMRADECSKAPTPKPCFQAPHAIDRWTKNVEQESVADPIINFSDLFSVLGWAERFFRKHLIEPMGVVGRLSFPCAINF